MLDKLAAVDRESKIDDDCATAVGGTIGLTHLVDNLQHYLRIRRLDEFEKRLYANVIRGIERELVKEKSDCALTSLRGTMLDN